MAPREDNNKRRIRNWVVTRPSTTVRPFVRPTFWVLKKSLLLCLCRAQPIRPKHRTWCHCSQSLLHLLLLLLPIVSYYVLYFPFPSGVRTGNRNWRGEMYSMNTTRALLIVYYCLCVCLYSGSARIGQRGQSAGRFTGLRSDWRSGERDAHGAQISSQTRHL